MIVYRATNEVNGKSYIGITNSSVDARWQVHVNAAISGRQFALSRAIRKYGPGSFALEELVRDLSREEASSFEREYIALFNTTIPHGYNMTFGGDGGDTLLDPEVRKSFGAKMSDFNRKTWADPDIRARRSAGIKAAQARPDVKEKQQAARLRPGAKEKLSAVLKANWQDPVVRARILEARNTPAIKAVQSELAKARWSCPDKSEQMRAAMRATRSLPEAKAAVAIRNRAMWSDPLVAARIRQSMSERWNTDEGRAILSENAKKLWSDPAKKAVLVEQLRQAAARPHVKAARGALTKAMWTDPEIRERLSGANHWNSRAVLIDGIAYPTMTAAGRALGLTPSTISWRIKNGFPGHSLLRDGGDA